MRLLKGFGLTRGRQSIALSKRSCSMRRFTSTTKPRSSFRHTLFLGGLGFSILAIANIGLVNANGAQCDARYSPDEVGEVPLDGEYVEKITVPSRATKISCATYKANFPIEDKFDVQQSKNSGVYALVLDGHGGWQVSEYGKQVLINNVRLEVEQLTVKSKQQQEVEVNGQDGDVSSVKTVNPSRKEQVAGAIQRGFNRTDRDLMGKVAEAFKLGFGAVARCGSCALLVYVEGNVLHVANAGDIRAVLGKTPSGSADYVAVPLSSDQNAMSKIEQERLKAEHPGEENVFVCRHPDSCYVKSALQPTRALGDFALKYSEFNGPPYVNGDRSAGRHIAAPYTPPYISAVPEIRTHELTKEDKFVIIGSDGVWDFLSNEEAVNTVWEQLANGTPEQAARAVVERTLQTAAMQYGLSLSELLSLPPGSHRRRKHDDTTAVVVFFD